MRLRVLFAAAVLVLVGLGTPAHAGTDRVLTITTGNAGPAQSFKHFDTPLDAFDFNGDGRREIIAHNDNRHVYVFDSGNGRILADLTTPYPGGWGARPLNAPEAEVLVKGGKPHVVVANSASVITLFRYDGQSGGDMHFTKVWDKRTTACHGDPGMDAQPVLYDLDGDGDLEILVQTEEVGVYALRMDGSTMWKQCIGGGNGEPAVADMDFDGVPDVVFASDGGVVTRINGRTGKTICTFWASNPDFGLGVASIPVGPTIGQINGRGALDVAFGARDTSSREDPHSNRAALFAMRGDCALLWMRQHPQATPLTYTHPIIHDVDNDGEADILWADWNTVGHKPPYSGDATDPWAVSGTAAVYRYDSTGDLRYRKEIGSYWNNKDLALADVDGDGVQEIIADDGARMVYLDSRTGRTEAGIDLNGWVPTRGPTVWNLKGHGTMQWIMPVHRGGAGGIMVFDTYVGYNAAWPHVPSGKATGGGGSSPPPPSGSFSASFDVPDTTNNWWVETYVDANQGVQRVTARVDGGSPHDLQKRSWGSWAASFHVPDGSKVVLTAHATSGERASSGTYTWGSGGGGGGSDFSVRFEVPDNVNEWWVEVDTFENHELQKVEARINGGSPKNLPRTSWGTWAKSYHAPAGSSVEFIATDVHGHVATSKTYTWLSDGSGFSASFKPGDTSNNWWVEVTVDANRPLDRVHASVDGGSWQNLPRTDWGTWAKSFHVADGSDVRFRATNTDGQRIVSDPVRWG